MIFKGRQNLKIHRRTLNNELPNVRSQKFLLNYLRQHRLEKTSGEMRAALGLTRWLLNKKRKTQNRIGFRTSCFITGRARGLTQRFSVARTKIKSLADSGTLPGVRKSSW
jgi:ribosomal protein S14